MRHVFLVLLLLGAPLRAHAEWQIKPFAGLTFGGGTNIFGDNELQVGKRKGSIGVSTAVIGEVFGAEADVGFGPGFFDDSKLPLIVKSSLATVTGNLIVALPRRIAQYSLRPYFVVGTGLIHTTAVSSPVNVPSDLLNRNFLAIDMGVGATGFIGRRTGVSWEPRHFRTAGGRSNTGTTDGETERFSFWRANMALAIRF